MRHPLLSSFFLALVISISIEACTGGSDPSETTDGGTNADSSATDGNVSSDGNPSTTDGSSGNDSSSGATPQTIITMYGGAAAGCQTVPGMSVGDFGDPQAGKPARPVKNGAAEDGGTVSVTCRVAPNGANGFDFTGTVTYAGTGTTLDVSGTLDDKGKTVAGKMTLKKTGGATWTNNACSFNPTGSVFMGVAAGRYWTLLSCGQSTSATNEKCDIFGQIRFENCTPS